jgi:cytoskeletal protein CcmA (bactofilin family)
MSTNSISRVNYFSGEAPLTADFQDEQKYHIEMREQLCQGLLTPGIVNGLDVKFKSASVVTVCAGTALDRNGRLIVLAKDTDCHPTLLAEGRGNYLTISFDELQTELVAGQGYKRWLEAPQIAVKQTFDPQGEELLLAVIAASSGLIQSIYYYSGDYARRHVGATLQSIDFKDGSNPSSRPAASVSMSDYRLEIDAPKIELDGAVKANNVVSANGTFSGNFDGTLTGDGTQLTLPQPPTYWTQDAAGNLWYSDGNVAIGDTDASRANLTVKRGDAAARAATGLISLEPDGVTVWGYQTRFLSEVSPGDILAYDYAPEQVATIVNVTPPYRLEIDERFPIDLGPSFYHTQITGQPAQLGAGTVSVSGTQVTCTDRFPQGLAAGDKLILDASREDSPKYLRVQTISSDTQLTVAALAGAHTSAGPKLSAFSTTPCALLEVGGANPPSPQRPPALVAVQNGEGATPATSVSINQSSVASGKYALDVAGAVLLDDVQLASVTVDSALTVNGGMTVAGDVTVGGGLIINDNLTVDAKTGTVTVAHTLNAPGAVTAEGAADIKGKVTVENKLNLNADLTVEGTLNGVGNLLQVKHDMDVGTLTIGGMLAGKTDPLPVDGGLTTVGELTAAAATIYGDLTVTGNIIGAVSKGVPEVLQDPTGGTRIQLLTGHGAENAGWQTHPIFQLTGHHPDLFLCLTTDNGADHLSTDSADWFSYCFKVSIGGVMTLYTCASQGIGMHNGFGVVNPAMMMAPVPKNMSIEVTYHISGKAEYSFHAYIWTVPFG